MAQRLLGFEVVVLQKLEASGNRVFGYKANGRKIEFQLNGHKIVNHMDSQTEERKFFRMFKPGSDTLYMIPLNGNRSLIFGERKPLFGKKEMHVLVSTPIHSPNEGGRR